MVSRRQVLGAGAFVAGLAAAGCAAPAPPTYRAADVGADEHARTIAAMRPPKRGRPVIAVLADNAGTETTDYIAPLSVLTRSGCAEVHALALHDGPVTMHPALRIQPSSTTSAFDARCKDGADYVIVPALHDPRSADAVAWIRRQRASGATIVGICAGALVLAHAGLLESRNATTHWDSIDDMRRISPGVIWRRDRRYVADRGIVTTTGVSASLPVSLALVEAIAGRRSAEALAQSLGVASFAEGHDSAAFSGRKLAMYAQGARNLISGRERLGVAVADGVDELALAFAADAWSRTYRSACVTVGAGNPVRTLGGLTILVETQGAAHLPLVPVPSGPPGQVLDAVLDQISRRYGASTAAFVATQLEFPRPELT